MGSQASHTATMRCACRKRQKPVTTVTLNLAPASLFCVKFQRLDDQVLFIVGNYLAALELGRLSQTCSDLSKTLSSDVAWFAALKAAGAPPSKNPRQTLKSIATLQFSWECVDQDLDCGPCARQHHVAFATKRTLVLFAGSTPNRRFLADSWALDVLSGKWTQAATASSDKPAARKFSADGGGGGVLTDGAGNEWLVIFGGLRAEGFRDNETWMLGPLGLAPDSWKWYEVQEDFSPQSDSRPCARFHHTQTVIGAGTLVVVGGHNYRIQLTGQMGVLNFSTLEFDSAGRPDLDTLSWSLDPLASPRIRRAHHAAVGWQDHVVIFGGEDVTESPLGDTWLWDKTNQSWHEVPALFNGGRSRASAAIVNGSILVISGGHGLSADMEYDDIWTLDLNEPSNLGWINIARPGESIPSLPLRNAHLNSSSAVIHDGKTLLVFGGHKGSRVDHFGDPTGGFFSCEQTWVARFPDKGRVVCASLCSGEASPAFNDRRFNEGDTDPFSASWTAVKDLGTLVFCRIYDQRLIATNLYFK